MLFHTIFSSLRVHILLPLEYESSRLYGSAALLVYESKFIVVPILYIIDQNFLLRLHTDLRDCLFLCVMHTISCRLRTYIMTRRRIYRRVSWKLITKCMAKRKLTSEQKSHWREVHFQD